MPVAGGAAGAPFGSTAGVAAPSERLPRKPSTRERMGPISAPPTPTIRMPATVARNATRTGIVTVVPMPIWFTAAITPSAMMRNETVFATSEP